MKIIPEFLEDNAARFPGRIAAEDETCALTWGELCSLSENAGTAIGRLLPSGRPVVIFMEKQPRMLAAMFGAA